MEWLQPSGRRPEGCCCSTELSGGRGQLPEATGYRHRRTMHVPCMPRLTLADVCGRQPDSHQSFDPTSRNAAGRCSTSASMCGTRETQRGQRSGDGEGRDCSPPRSDGHGALTSTLGTLERCQQPLSANPGGLLLVPDAPSAGADGAVVWNVIRMRLGSRDT